jgi:hypothetical protein
MGSGRADAVPSAKKHRDYRHQDTPLPWILNERVNIERLTLRYWNISANVGLNEVEQIALFSWNKAIYYIVRN